MVDPETITADGESLTGHVMLNTLKRHEEGQEFFFCFDDPLDLAQLTEALARSPHGPVSILHPEYITSLDHKVDGDSLTGRVEFRATSGIYEGAVGFEAIRVKSENDGWLITVFVIGEDNRRLERKGRDEPWNLNTLAPGAGTVPRP